MLLPALTWHKHPQKYQGCLTWPPEPAGTTHRRGHPPVSQTDRETGLSGTLRPEPVSHCHCGLVWERERERQRDTAGNCASWRRLGLYCGSAHKRHFLKSHFSVLTSGFHHLKDRLCCRTLRLLLQKTLITLCRYRLFVFSLLASVMISYDRRVRIRSAVSDAPPPRGLQPAGLLCPRDSLRKNTGVGCHALLWVIFPLLCLLHWLVDYY